MSSFRRQLRLTHQPLLGGLLGICALGAVAVGCEHAQAVKDLIPDPDGGGDGSGGGGGGAPVDPPIDRTQGQDPTAALTPSGTTITADFTEPVVEEEGRASCGDTPVRDLYIPDSAVQEEAAGIVSRMNIDQKVVQLTGVKPPGNTFPYPPGSYEDIQRSDDDPALNLRGYQWRDGPHGLNLEAGVNRDNFLKSDGTGNNSTSFPTSVVQGATFNFELVRQVGEAMADETVAAGNTVLLGPCMNVLRHPYWGRAQETFGEDTFHLGRIGTALSIGIQEHIAGCAKHYIANNIEQRRFFISSDMDEQTLRETYARHFEMVVRDGGIACMMASYNAINGKKQTQNQHTLTTMLRDDMGFKGFTLTDWWAMPGANTGQGPVDAPQDEISAAEALRAGLDVEVPWALNYDAIPKIVANGTVGVDLVDLAVKRVLEQKLRFKSAYLDEPAIGLATPDTSYDAVNGNIINTEAHAQLASKAAEEGMVLVKNENSVLPIASTVTKVAVIGATVDYEVRSDNPRQKKFNFVTDAALGDRGSSRVRPHPSLTVGPLAGIQAAAPQGVEVVSGDTAAAVGDAGFVVVVVGLTAGDEGEEYTGASDRSSLTLPDVHNQLVQSVAALNKPMVVVIEAGGVVDMPWLSQVPSVVMAWYPGQRGGEALGRLLFNQANFAGRLPVTWPASIDQFPNFNDGEATTMDYFVGYKYLEQYDKGAPLYAFGHGLSYSTFRYERLHIPCSDISSNGLIQVEVDVRNTAGPAGDEVVMVFAKFPQTAYRRAKKELRGFARVNLGVGELKRVNIPIRVQDLKVWDTAANRWVIERGPVEFHVGPSSDKLVLAQTVNITGPAPAE